MIEGCGECPPCPVFDASAVSNNLGVVVYFGAFVALFFLFRYTSIKFPKVWRFIIWITNFAIVIGVIFYFSRAFGCRLDCNCPSINQGKDNMSIFSAEYMTIFATSITIMVYFVHWKYSNKIIIKK